MQVTSRTTGGANVTEAGGIAGARRPLLAIALAVLLTLFVAAPAQGLVREISQGDPGTNDQFGTSIAVDGDTLVIGAPLKGYPSAPVGAAYVFTRTANETWTQTSKLLASDGANNDLFGSSVGIDGGTIVVGAPGDDGAASDTGSIYTFDRACV